jgi:sigma-B regulation protein RsbU (phosphoserine phosphatase)
MLISDSGEATKLTGGDLPVGLFSEIRYRELRVSLSKGSNLVVYTDGVTDALNSKGEEFGEERLMSCCRAFPKGANAEAISTLLSAAVT